MAAQGSQARPRVVLLLVLALILAAGAGGAYWWMLGPGGGGDPVSKVSEVRPGMSQEEVRHILGSPNYEDVRFDGTVQWTYTNSPSNKLAAVWFKRDGTVYGAEAKQDDGLRPGRSVGGR